MFNGVFMNPASSVFGLAILLATFVGPIAAVIVTRWVDARRDEYQRRLSIFRTLMATRAVGLNPERVAALNMIQIDFVGHEKVLSAWHELLRHYGTPVPTGDIEGQNYDRERQRFSTVLLSEMAKVLKLKIEQMDILDRVYYPSGLVQIEKDQEIVRRFLVEILSGQRALPVLVFTPNTSETEHPVQ